MSHKRLFQSIMATLYILSFMVGCGTPSSASVVSTATLAPKPPAIQPTQMPTLKPPVSPTPTISPSPTITPTPTVGPGGFPRSFHVKGNAFVDQFDQPMIFRGMASPDVVQMALKTNPELPAWNEKYYQTMAKWGANIIRVPITPYGIQRTSINQMLLILDQTIAWAGANNMYVIIDFHSCGWLPDNWFFPNSGNETTVEEWTNFWDAISKRYADNDVVAFYELFNEPALNSHWPYRKQDWLVWKDTVEPLINKTIRPNDPDKIILIGGLQAGYDLSYTLSAPITDISNNVGYATQPYSGQFLANASYASPSGWDAAFGKLSEKYPVFAIEFGYEKDFKEKGARDPNIGNIPYHQAIIDYLEEHHISWTVWVFDSFWSTRLLKNNRTFEPSESGEYFRSRLVELNPHP
jgi:endoglucanase